MDATPMATAIRERNELLNRMLPAYIDPQDVVDTLGSLVATTPIRST
jgi:hypothetical protein